MVEADDREKRKAAARQKRILGAENRVKALEYRKMGLSYADIGRQLGISLQAAHKHVQKALAEIRKTQDRSAEELQTLELERLDRMQQGAWPSAIRGDPQSIAKIIDIMRTRDRLVGHFKPEKHANTDPTGEREATPHGEMTDAELEARIDELLRKRDGAQGAA